MALPNPLTTDFAYLCCGPFADVRIPTATDTLDYGFLKQGPFGSYIAGAGGSTFNKSMTTTLNFTQSLTATGAVIAQSHIKAYLSAYKKAFLRVIQPRKW